jgi:hypothetical protein
MRFRGFAASIQNCVRYESRIVEYQLLQRHSDVSEMLCRRLQAMGFPPRSV